MTVKECHYEKLSIIDAELSSSLFCFTQWNVRYTQRQDNFYSNYFTKTQIAMTCNVAKRNLLLSGDIEINPRPVINNSTSLGVVGCFSMV